MLRNTTTFDLIPMLRGTEFFARLQGMQGPRFRLLRFPGSTRIDSVPRPKKRRKTGLNSRNDKMMENLNVLHRSPLRRSRDRVYSAGSSSVSSYDPMPTTPVYSAHKDVQFQQLGDRFSVIKMREQSCEDGESDDDASTHYAQVRRMRLVQNAIYSLNMP